MKERTILGHIDCPTCGSVQGMRITLDKNQAPFGYCEADCGQQLRIGGDRRRVSAFVARFPFAAGQAEAPAPGAGDKPAPPAAAKAIPAPMPVPVPPPSSAKPAKQRSAFADAVRLLGGG